jgi:Ser/Thr protein kinase RdoA (MazF antagonist)
MKTSVFDTAAPLLSKNEASKIVLEHFGIEGIAKDLVSYSDQNFKILGEHKSYILKISNSAEAYNVLDMQNKAMKHLAVTDMDLGLPLPLPSVNGEEIIKIESNGESNYVRLLHYVNGKFMKDVNQSDTMLFELGAFLGKLDLSLKDFNHPASKRPFPWDVRFIDFLNHIILIMFKIKR